MATPTHRFFADALAPYKLRWYEEPLDPLDYAAHAILAERYAPPLATGENLFSMYGVGSLRLKSTNSLA